MTKPKKSKAPAEKRTPAPTIDLKSLCSALDAKDRDFYDRLSDELKKKFSGFLTLRYASSVQGDNLLADYYLRSANQHANMNFFDISLKLVKLKFKSKASINPLPLEFIIFLLSKFLLAESVSGKKIPISPNALAPRIASAIECNRTSPSE